MKVVALKKKSPSFGEVLAQTAKAPKAARKTAMPTLQAPPEVAAAVDEYQDAKTNMKMAEAAMNSAGDIITEFVRTQQDKDGYAGKYQGSYAVLGNRHQAKVIFANKYTISPEDEGRLAEILGERFDEMVEKKFSVKLRAEVFESEELQAELMALVGERFGDFFETAVSLAARECFSQAVYRAVAPEDLQLLRTFARQFKPSIR
ncbi:MAG: hypothetical protein QME75_10610 [Deltaproteobacteria bacterium]|nr:hypothetical protein [Deltaproteobacteria bacterium]